jgi:hypothetical protein
MKEGEVKIKSTKPNPITQNTNADMEENHN